MNKFGAVLIVIAMMVAVNLFLLVVMPVVVDIISTANATMTASSNLTNYPGTQGAFVSTPWILFFIPNCILMALIVMILKRP